MGQDRFSPARSSCLFAFPFRIFFLSAALIGAVLVPVWLLFFHHGGGGTLTMPAWLWHQHEMTVGFLNAAIAGFLLTAVCNWTGTPPLAGPALAGLWLLWLAGRLALAFGAGWPLLAAVVDMAFLPVVALIVAQRVWRARQPRQAPLVGVLLLLAGMDLLFHLQHDPRFTRALVLLAATLILVIGGRITPAFTANWLRQHGANPARVRQWPWLDKLGLIAALLVVVLELGTWRGGAAAVIGLLAATLTAIRLWGWAGWLTRREPLLWILHLGHLWVVLGYVLWALAAIGQVAPTAWLHALGAGAIGTMILGVMTRVAMGHTGRPLRLLPGMGWGYGAMLAAGAVRVTVALGGMPPRPGLWLAAVLWTLALGLFVVRYGPLLASPRADGRPG